MSEQIPSESATDKEKSDLSASIEWLRSLSTMAGAIIRLAIAEISLAKEDLGRLIISSLLMIPLAVLTWIAFTLLAAWQVYALSASVGLGLLTFAAIQLFAVLLLLNRIKVYRRSLTLPATRTQILSIIDEIRRDAGNP
jgi:uncharacterized membrane protein YqjE